MINSLIFALGDSAINLIKDLNKEMNVPCIFISNRKSNNVFNIPTNLIYIIESEKINTDYDDKFMDIMEEYLYYDHYFIISDIGDDFSHSSAKVFGKHLGEKTTGIFILPFGFEKMAKGKNVEELTSDLRDFYKRYFIFRDEYLFKVFYDAPLKMLPKLKSFIIYNLINNINESLEIEDLKFLEKGELGFGISINERMDKIQESLVEAIESPWIKKTHENLFIIFNGNITVQEVIPLLNSIRIKNYKIKINKVNKGRKVFITAISY